MLKIENLSVKVEKRKILDGVSLNIKPGKVIVLMGPNGSGKTTLAQTLAGTKKYQISNIKYQKKEIVLTIDGRDLLKMSVDERARARLFVSFQNPVDIRGVKVFDFLYSVSPREKMSVLKFKELVIKEAKKLGLSEKILDRDLNRFSGGERKRLELLQAILLKPKYVIFDEIDSGVDIDGLKIIEKAVRRLQRRGVGILLITHQPRILKFIKPAKIHVLIGGRIVRSGNSEILKKLEMSGYRSFYCAACECREVECPKHRVLRHSEHSEESLI